MEPIKKTKEFIIFSDGHGFDVECYIYKKTYLSDYLNTKEPKTFKDKLLYLWDAITTPFYRIKHSVRNTYWNVRYGFQRMFKGYDSVDTFETYQKFIDRYTKILTEYREKHVGYVGTMTNKEWESIIDRMICCLYFMDEQNVRNELEDNIPDNWTVSQESIDNIMSKYKDEFFKLFSEYFYNLWD